MRILQEVIINFSDDVSLANFKIAMENNIVPYLKRKYENDFINGVIVRRDTANRERSWIGTLLRMDKLTDPKNLDSLFNYQKGMDALSKERIKFGESEFRLDDLFFIYNLIVNKDRFGSDRLTKLFKNYITDRNSLAADLYEYYSDIDSGKKELYDNLTPELKDAIAFGVLSVRGNLSTTNGDKLSIPNPNFTVVTSINKTNESAKRIRIIEDIKKYLKASNVIIQFNCNG